MDLDRALTDEWYARLPAALRDLDNGDLFAYLRVPGDPSGGIRLTLSAIDGTGTARPLVLSDGTTLTWLNGDLTVEGQPAPDDQGVIVPVEEPATSVVDDDVLMILTADWRLSDLSSVPRVWLPWLAQVLSVDLTLLPSAVWRDWIGNPVSRITGSLAAIEATAGMFLLDSVPFTVSRTDQWTVTVELQDEALLVDEAVLQAAVDRVAPAGVAVVLDVT
jgi:hypothetical protein